LIKLSYDDYAIGVKSGTFLTIFGDIKFDVYKKKFEIIPKSIMFDKVNKLDSLNVKSKRRILCLSFYTLVGIVSGYYCLKAYTKYKE